MMINALSGFNYYSQFGQQQGIQRNPDAYAQRYANQKGLSLEEAKSELKTQYGEPSQQSQVNSYESYGFDSEETVLSTDMDFKTLFKELLNTLRGPQNTQNTQNTQKQDGLPQDQDPDSYAQQYADENGISIDEAKAELEEKYGKPQQPNKNFFMA